MNLQTPARPPVKDVTMTASTATRAAVIFSRGSQYPGAGWGFWSNGGCLPAGSVVGQRVTLATDYGLILERTWVAEFDDTRGMLTVAGGLQMSAYGDDSPQPAGAVYLSVSEIARGYTHAPRTGQRKLRISEGAIHLALRTAQLPRYVPGKVTGYVVSTAGTAATLRIKHLIPADSDHERRMSEALLSACRLTLAEAGYKATTTEQAVTITVR